MVFIYRYQIVNIMNFMI